MANLWRVFFGSVRRAQVTLALAAIGTVAVLMDPTIPNRVLYRLLVAAQPAIQLAIDTATSLLVAVAPIAVMFYFISRAFRGGGKKKK